MAVFPVIPGHSFRIDLNIEVLTIQIGVETSVVPPGACITQGTFATTSFVISIYTLSDLGDLSNLIGSLSRTI